MKPAGPGSLWREYLDAVVRRVGDVDPPFMRDRDATRPVELAPSTGTFS